MQTSTACLGATSSCAASTGDAARAVTRVVNDGKVAVEEAAQVVSAAAFAGVCT